MKRSRQAMNKENKGRFLVLFYSLFIFLFSFADCVTAPKGPDELDVAIRETSDYLNSNIPGGNKIAIINIQSESSALSNYVIDEMIANAVNDKVFSVVDRQQLDAIRMELDFNMSGEVSDASAQAIGQMLGAQTIVTGSIGALGERHRMTVRALAVETAQVQGQFNRNFPASPTLTALLKSTSPGSGSAQTQAAKPAQPAAQSQTAGSQGTRQQPAPIVVEKTPAPVQPAPLKNGTYTFYPRLRVMQGGVDKGAYLDRIVIRSGYFTVYLVDTPMGKGGTYNLGGNGWGGSAQRYVILQDLDRPSRAYNPTNTTEDEVSGGVGITFQGVTATRFSLTNNYVSPPLVFDEIILGEPDK